MLRQHKIAAILLILIVTTACATSAQRIAYTTIDSAVTAVQTSLKAWNEGFYTPGVKVDPALWNARRDALAGAYGKFQITARLATTLATDLSQKDNGIKIASDAAADFIALVASLEKK